MSRAELMTRLGSSEYNAWALLEKIEPFGESGAWLRNALVCSTIANVNRKPGSEPIGLETFLPETMREEAKEAEEPKQTPEQMRSIMFMFIARQEARKQREMANNGGDSGAR